ncbi:FMNH2-utilizing oxygenase [Pseudonocardia dioxanivorans CB1190]|uniref:FMNH2-utilizing oxygenase n=1 Tax=Pseudonocardia dioxanivorans (strain ATCC 55486 / DSM 44775 / JCM 13855 / CB1190) TaxID=675635 RepID=F4D1Q1_PSEUX|nr:LLM class flavin-dependent oxidoreductase [Pseudonocardia dioxanivorans]AEA27961.1 FMNH2-utilizing oxygenase [Pseudonocardia dioxanivorans CB1190]GJF05298.1 FMNH2-utilizing oxygenase [Pseudonocardia sp. D17]
MPDTPLHLGVLLDGAGRHPAAWREPQARPTDLFTAGYWAELVAEAEQGLLDLVTLDDTLGLQSADAFALDPRTDQVRGRLDASMLAARIAPLTSHVGILPTVVVTHTEPFHVSTTIATLDYVSSGRGGVQVRVSGRAEEAQLFGRRTLPTDRDELLAELFDEAADAVEVIRRLWDSWEDDAIIRDAATGRFVDRERLHYIDFEGRHFSVRGPSITPRPPQGQPIVAALAHRAEPFALVGTSADLGFVTPRDTADARTTVGAIREAQAAAGREAETVHVWADLTVVLDDDASAARDRLARLDSVAAYTDDARVFAGSPAELADLMADLRTAGLSGFRLRPAVLPDDLRQVTRGLVPELQRRGQFRTGYEASTLRGLLGLPRPADRYATVVRDRAGSTR